METITKIPGLQHISEDIFKLLDGNSLMNCRVTNSSWKNVLEQSIFWLQKLRMEGWKALAENIGDQKIAKYFVRDFVELVILSSSYLNSNYWIDRARGSIIEEYNGRILYMKEYRPLSDIKSMWIALLQELENDHQSKEFVLILIKIYNNRSKLLALGVVVPLININKYPDLVKSILENENPRSKVSCFFMTRKLKVYHENVTSIHLAAFCGLIGVVEKLSKKYDDPMVESHKGANAIHIAALNGHFNIVKYLMEFTKATLAPDINGWTPIHYAAGNGNLDTIKFLVGLTKTPNTPDNYGKTPIKIAKLMENVEVKKFLENHSK